MIFAAKTTASGLVALLVAFTFNLDQPQWALLTVVIVAQPQSGLVLAKSFYRIVGALIGAAVALLVVALFAQERVLFLGALALWVGLCTFGSQYARSFIAYGFVLSGYTVAIVGIPGALDAGNAFYVAMARVTEISLGIIVTATISHVVLPDRLAVSLWKAVADTRVRLAEYAAAVIDDGDIRSLRAKVISQAIASENMRSSAVFEDREVRARSNLLRVLNAALINVIAVAQPLGTRLDIVQRNGDRGEAAIDDARAEATAAITAWRSGNPRCRAAHGFAQGWRPATTVRLARVFCSVRCLCRSLRRLPRRRPQTAARRHQLRPFERRARCAVDRDSRCSCGVSRQLLLDTERLAARVNCCAPCGSGDSAARDDGRRGANRARRHADFRFCHGTGLYHRRGFAAARFRLRDVQPDRRADDFLLRPVDGEQESEAPARWLSLGAIVRLGVAVPEPYGLRPRGSDQHIDRCRFRRRDGDVALVDPRAADAGSRPCTLLPRGVPGAGANCSAGRAPRSRRVRNRDDRGSRPLAEPPPARLPGRHRCFREGGRAARCRPRPGRNK